MLKLDQAPAYKMVGVIRNANKDILAFIRRDSDGQFAIEYKSQTGEKAVMFSESGETLDQLIAAWRKQEQHPEVTRCDAPEGGATPQWLASLLQEMTPAQPVAQPVQPAVQMALAEAPFPKEIKNESTCPSKKKQFATSAEAEAFADELRIKYPNQVSQRAYPCDECPCYHLTTMDSAAYAMSTSRRILPRPVPEKAPQRARRGEMLEQAKALIRENPDISAREAADKMNTSYSSAGNALSRARKATPQAFIPATVESLEQEEVDLKRRLENLAAKKAALIEARALKLRLCQDGRLLIQKESEHMAIKLEDVPELAEKLMDFVQPATQTN